MKSKYGSRKFKTLDIPTAAELFAIAQKSGFQAFENYVENALPEDLTRIARDIGKLSRTLNTLMREFDKMRMDSLIIETELLREEEKTRRERERQERCQRDEAKFRKQALRNLKGVERSFYKRTGVLMEEFVRRAIEEFKKSN